MSAGSYSRNDTTGKIGKWIRYTSATEIATITPIFTTFSVLFAAARFCWPVCFFTLLLFRPCRLFSSFPGASYYEKGTSSKERQHRRKSPGHSCPGLSVLPLRSCLRNNCELRSDKYVLFSHPDYTVGTGIPSYESHRFSRTSCGSRTIPPVGTCTRPRRFNSFYVIYYNSLEGGFQGLFFNTMLFPATDAFCQKYKPRYFYGDRFGHITRV